MDARYYSRFRKNSSSTRKNEDEIIPNRRIQEIQAEAEQVLKQLTPEQILSWKKKDLQLAAFVVNLDTTGSIPHLQERLLKKNRQLTAEQVKFLFMKVPQLKKELAKRQQKVSGLKWQLQIRLLECTTQQMDEPTTTQADSVMRIARLIAESFSVRESDPRVAESSRAIVDSIEKSGL
jgi:hypothetical protein